MKLFIVFSLFFTCGICGILPDSSIFQNAGIQKLQSTFDLSDVEDANFPREKRCPRVGAYQPQKRDLDQIVSMRNPMLQKAAADADPKTKQDFELGPVKKRTRGEMVRLCGTCMTTFGCKDLDQCINCLKWCFPNNANITAEEKAGKPEGEPIIVDENVGMAQPQIQNRFADTSENSGRLYTLATVQPGKHMDLICRFFGIEEKNKQNIEQIMLLAKTRTDGPLVTLPQQALLQEENQLADKLNQAIDEAENRKKQLTPEEIVDVVEKVLHEQNSPNTESRLGEVHEEPTATATKEIKPVTEADATKPIEAAEELPSDAKPEPKTLLDKFRKHYHDHRNSLMKKLKPDETTLTKPLIVQSKDTLESDSQVQEPGKSIIVQPKSSIDPEDDDDDDVDGDDDNVGSSKKTMDDFMEIKEPEHAMNVLENLKKQVSNAQGNEELDRAKNVLGRIQSIVEQLEKDKENVNTEDKEKLKMIEDTLGSPKMEERIKDDDEITGAPKKLTEQVQEPEKKMAQASAKPATIFKNIFTTTEAPVAVAPRSQEPAVPKTTNEAPPVGEASKAEEPAATPEDDKLNPILALEKAMQKLHELTKKAQEEANKLRSNDNFPKERAAELMEKLKKAHDEALQRQAEMLKQHEQNRQNILESIRSKFFKNEEPATPENGKVEAVNPQTDKVEAINPENLEKVPEINSRNTLESINEEEEQKGKLGSLVGYDPQKQENSNIYFLGDGVKLPMKMVSEPDGSIQLSVDIDKICSCKNSTCPKKRDIAAVVGTILEKEAELKDELETSHHGLSAKLVRSTDKLIKELENAGFQVEEEIVMLPNENITVPIFPELKDNSTNLENEEIDSSPKGRTPHLSHEEEKLLKMLLQPVEDNKTTTEKIHTIVNRSADYTIFDNKALYDEKPNEYNKFSEKFDDKINIKPFKAIQIEKALEKKLETLEKTVEDKKQRAEQLVAEETKKILKAKNDKTVKKEVDLASNILSFMKSLATDK